LIGENSIPYQSTVVGGKANGQGKFVVGTENVSLSAEADSNFQLVGWLVEYSEQPSRENLFIDTNGLDDYGAKTVTLFDSENEEIEADVKFETNGKFMTSGTFSLAYVFENIIVRPVFDHVYYMVDISDLALITRLANPISIGSDELYFTDSEVSGSVTIYKNAYIKIGTSYNYYGNLFLEDGEYYTEHQTLTDTPSTQKVEYSRGAFRVNDNVQIEYNVKIDAADIYSSKNIDLQGVTVIGGSNRELSLVEAGNLELNTFEITKDDLSRTSAYKVKFSVEETSSYQNKVDIDYHNLYVVDISITIDHVELVDEVNDILGEIVIGSNDITGGNVTINNFYVKTDANKLQFLVKKASDNQSKAFAITSKEYIKKEIDGQTYNYYTFKSNNGEKVLSNSYANISYNREIVLDYIAADYEISFVAVEYEKVDESHVLTIFDGNVLDSQIKTRVDAAITLNKESLDGIENIGYAFKGYALALDGEILETLVCGIDRNKPSDIVVYICFEKIEYNLIIKNINAVAIGSDIAVKQIQVDATYNQTNQQEVFDGLTNADATITPTFTLKLGSNVTISHLDNAGFKVDGFKFEDGLDIIENGQFVITEEVITNYVKSVSVDEDVIYNLTLCLVASKNTYTITYYIEATEDDKLNKDVIMADISTNRAGVKKLYNAAGAEICEANNNLLDDVAKVEITINDLEYGEHVELISAPITADDGIESYIYIFNWYTQDDRSTLSREVIDENSDGIPERYKHIATVVESVAIKVVYSMPTTTLYVTVNSDLTQLIQDGLFSFNYTVAVSGTNDPLELVGDNLYKANVGEQIRVVISNISNGYIFKGYTYKESAEGNGYTSVNDMEFIYAVKTGINTLELDFKAIEYHFVFTQHGGDRDDVIVKFDEEKEYALVSLDNLLVEINKPEGYFVYQVVFDENYFDLSEVLSESNDDREVEEKINKYTFTLTRDQLLYLIENHSVKEIGNEVETVYVDLYYEIFKYEVKLGFGFLATRPEKDDRIFFPTIKLFYGYDQNYAEEASYSVYNKVITFTNIPYNANVKLQMLGTTMPGTSAAGWYHDSGSRVTEYQSDDTSLLVNALKNDKSFVFKISYNTYYIKTITTSGEGNGLVYIKNQPIEDEQKPIEIFDSFQFAYGPSQGYRFASMSYLQYVYTEVDMTQDIWNEKWDSLYVQTLSDYYQINVNQIYDSKIKYYERTIETVEVDGEFFGNFNLSKYVLDDEDGKTVIFNFNFELRQFKITNSIATSGFTYFPSLFNVDIPERQLDLSDDVLANIEIKAEDIDGNITEITDYENQTVVYTDKLLISLKINKNAYNKANDKYYDLSKGLTLTNVKVGSYAGPGFRNTSLGEYSMEFTVKDYMSSDDVIEMNYTLTIQEVKVTATTNIAGGLDTVTFYENVDIVLDANCYSFFGAERFSNGASVVSVNLQFLAKLKAKATLTATYAETFEITGFKILINNSTEILEEDYDKWEIQYIDNVLDLRLLIAGYPAGGVNLSSVDIVFIVEPKVTYHNGGPNFVKKFKCDDLLNEDAQGLTVGSDETCDIQMPEMLAVAVEVTYDDGDIDNLSSVSLVGSYVVKLRFDESKLNESYKWVAQIVMDESITLTIVKKEVYLTYEQSEMTTDTKEYNADSNYDYLNRTYEFLYITDNSGFKKKYSEIIALGNNKLVLQNMRCYISSSGKDKHASDANQGNDRYNLYVYDLKLKDNDFNKNFKLNNVDLIINNYIQITKRQILVSNIKVFDKVFDSTTDAEIDKTQKISLSRVIEGDDISVDAEKIKASFANMNVGLNKKVVVDLSECLSGASALNYVLSNAEVSDVAIYPYSVTADLPGGGSITLYNERGLTDKTKVALIPINAVLTVNVVRPESNRYVAIYKKIRDYLRGNNEFSIGYELNLMANGKEQKISNELFLSTPKVKNLTGSYFLTGDKTGSVKTSNTKSLLIIDLQQIDNDVEYVFFTQAKILLKPWQIVLIVLAGVLLIAGVVLIFLIVRKRKIDRDSVHDKI